MKNPLAYFAAIAFCFAFCSYTYGQTSDLPRSVPEAEGVSTEKIIQFIEAADAKVNSMHSFMLIRHGKVIAEAWWAPESADKPHVLWSLSKSFTSTAVGLAIHEGHFGLDDPVIQFFPEELPADISDNLKAMRVRDLLTMAAGHATEAEVSRGKTWSASFLSQPVPYQPGTHFRYNTPATYMLSAIVQKETGETVLEFLKPRLFFPLGIRNPRWDASPQGISIGGYGLFLTTEDIAKFGQLLLQKGIWDEKQLVPSAWIEQATSKQLANGKSPTSDWHQGYGFQFWRCRHNAFRGDGKDGQFCLVLPDQEAVVVITANTRNLQRVLNLVWDNLLPAFHHDSLPPNPNALKQLQATTSNLKASR